MRGVTNEVRQTEGWLWGGRDRGRDLCSFLRKEGSYNLHCAQKSLRVRQLLCPICLGLESGMSLAKSLFTLGGVYVYLDLLTFPCAPLISLGLLIASLFLLTPLLLLVFGAGWLSSMAFRHCSARALLSPGRSQSLSSSVNVKVCILPELKHCSLPEATGRYFS